MENLKDAQTDGTYDYDPKAVTAKPWTAPPPDALRRSEGELKGGLSRQGRRPEPRSSASASRTSFAAVGRPRGSSSEWPLGVDPERIDRELALKEAGDAALEARDTATLELLALEAELLYCGIERPADGEHWTRIDLAAWDLADLDWDSGDITIHRHPQRRLPANVAKMLILPDESPREAEARVRRWRIDDGRHSETGLPDEQDARLARIVQMKREGFKTATIAKAVGLKSRQHVNKLLRGESH